MAYFSLFDADMDYDGKVSWIDDALYFKFFIESNQKPSSSEDTFGTNRGGLDESDSFDDDFDED